MYDIGEERLIEGTSIQGLLNPEKTNSYILKPGTTKVTIKSVIEDDIHLKRPNVKRLRGNKRRFIIGFTKKDVSINPKPAIKRLCIPFSKNIPLTA